MKFRNGLVFGILIFVLCTSFAPAKSSEKRITGVWEETWDPGQVSDVTYNDRYNVKYKKGEFQMSCIDRENYTFSHIHLTGTNFTFKLTNPSDPNDIYVIAYNMEVNSNFNFMVGTAVTNKGVEAKIELRKI